jgi:hypothetical protein
MTPEQKAGLMQLMGQTYGEAHKQDQMIIGSSGNLQPQSHQLRDQFEQVAKTPAMSPQHIPGPMPGPPPQPVAEAAEIKQITPEQAAQEIASVATESPPEGNQLEFDLSEPSKLDKLISLTEKQILLLQQINIKLGNGKTAKGNKQR